MYLVAGIVLERISGQRCEDFIRDRILLPLGMERATTSLEEMVERHSDYAAPHAVLDGAQRRIPVRPINTRPGGGVCASIADMAAYMRFHLDPVPGRGGLRLSPGAVAELTSPQSYVGRSDFAEVGQVHYGFGFDVVSYRGARRVSHRGGWSGYNCDLRLLPGTWQRGHGADERTRFRLCRLDEFGSGPAVGAGAVAVDGTTEPSQSHNG
jgi:CubicO group peptidase (beta-lactamase class C family)